jgi:tRNA(Arg) A34 adenosine deaminase TadA
MIDREITFRLPAWVEPILERAPAAMPDVEDRMRLVIEVAAEQVRQGTGGPFAAAVFDRSTWGLMSVAMNMVVPTSACVAHAEVLCLALAGQGVGSFVLPDAELVSTTEPCAMCLGAIPWSGVASLVCGAKDEDARAIGFDEGDKPPDWIDRLRRRGVAVTCGVLRDEVRAVLQAYVDAGGLIYNGGPAGSA